MTSKNNISDIVELKLYSCIGKYAGEDRNLFSIRFKAKVVKLLLNCFFSFKNRRRNRLSHYLYERQKRGLFLSSFLRMVEGYTVLVRPRDSGDLLINCRLEQKHSNKTEDENNSGINEGVRHIIPFDGQR